MMPACPKPSRVTDGVHPHDPSVPHLLEIEPVFDRAKAQELKLESTCVAGSKATVVLAP
jgi:hypothetical protein